MKKEANFYRVENFIGKPVLLVQKTCSLAQLVEKVKAELPAFHQFQILLEEDILTPEESPLPLEQIVDRRHENKHAPTFHIIEFPTEIAGGKEAQQFCQKMGELAKIEETKLEWDAANGHLLFEDQNSSLIASAFTHAATRHQKNPISMQNIGSLLSERHQKDKQMVSKQLKEITNLIAKLKQKKSREELVQSKRHMVVSKKYSNFDDNFATTLETTFIKYHCRSNGKLAYIEPKSMDFGMIDYKIKKTDVIGIIGDYGTGLADSQELLENMVKECNVNIILHLGDVYYAGTPEEYENNIMKFLRKVRLDVGSKKDIYFFSIPGNHDYYSWGTPFLCFIKNVNDKQLALQRASYFCLRTDDEKWQFLGGDTAYFDSKPRDQLNPFNTGPSLLKCELEWHKDKLQRFPGSTVFLTHHQLFSIHDRITGSLTDYRHFSCMNPLLSKQLFKYLPYMSAWFWGHEHSFMMFRDHFWGVPKCRLLGNSSFHVISQKEHPYGRHKDFPKIPFIADDDDYKDNYLPKHPDKKKEVYFNLTFAVINMAEAENNLLVEYFCSPCYSDSSKGDRHFKLYRLYQEEIESKTNIIENSFHISSRQRLFLKNEVGLVLDWKHGKFILNFQGLGMMITPKETKQLEQLKYMQEFYLQIDDIKPQFIASRNEGITIEDHPSENSTWILLQSVEPSETELKKTELKEPKPNEKDDSKIVTSLNTFSIWNVAEQKYLSFCIHMGTPSVDLHKDPSNWQFLTPENIINGFGQTT